MPGSLFPGGLSILRPAWQLSKAEQKQIFDNAVALAVEELAGTLKGNNNKIDVRGLRPYDLGETNDTWAETVAGSTTGAWADSIIADQNIRDDTAIAIYGVYDLTLYQAVTGVRIKAASAIRVEWDLFPILTEGLRPEYRTGFAMSPMVLGPNLPITVQHYARAASPAVVKGIEVVLLGVVAERVGRTITPKGG